MARSEMAEERRPAVRTRLLGAVWLVLFVFSVTLLLIASYSPETVSRAPIMGPVDVAAAFVLVVLLAVFERQRRTLQVRDFVLSTSIIAVVLPLGFVAFWLTRDSLVWNTLLPGLAWRSFVLVWGLPTVIAALRGRGVVGMRES